MQNLPTTSKDDNNKKPDFSAILHPFATNAILPPLIDMSSTQALLAMMRTAKESELQGLLKNVKRQETSSPLDLSAAAPPPSKRARTKASSGSNNNPTNHKRDQSESPRLQEDISNWTVDDVCNFVSGIDICAEYAQVSGDSPLKSIYSPNVSSYEKKLDRFLLAEKPQISRREKKISNRYGTKKKLFDLSLWNYSSFIRWTEPERNGSEDENKVSQRIAIRDVISPDPNPLGIDSSRLMAGYGLGHARVAR